MSALRTSVMALAVVVAPAQAGADVLFEKCPRPQPTKVFHSRADAEFGRLTVIADAGSRVYIDGKLADIEKLVGPYNGEPKTFEIEAGSHCVEVVPDWTDRDLPRFHRTMTARVVVVAGHDLAEITGTRTAIHALDALYVKNGKKNRIATDRVPDSLARRRRAEQALDALDGATLHGTISR